MSIVGPDGSSAVGIANIANLKCCCGCSDICGLGTLCVHPFFEGLPSDTTFDTFDVNQDGVTCDYSGTGSNTFMIQTVSTTHYTSGGITYYVFHLQLFYPSLFLTCSYATNPIPVTDFECPSFDVSYPLYGGGPGTCYGDYTLNGTSIRIKPGPCGVGVIAQPLSAQTATTTAMPTRSLPCVSLGERIEFRAGCDSGWMCRHACTSSRPDVVAHLGGVSEAVPGDDCQTCPGYSARC